ncbi:hypothetical protein M569_03572, partial [Genlisea aurea]
GGHSEMKWPEKITPPLVQQLIRSEKNLEKAVSIFDSATAEYSNGYRHDQSTFTLIIKRLLSANKFIDSEHILARMKQEDCEINEDVFISIYKAYARVHKPLEVVRSFEKMKEYGCEPSIKSYVTVFSVLVDEGHLKMAFRFYRDIKARGIPTDVPMLNVLIKALCKSDETLDSACEIFREMPKRGHAPDSYTYSTLISGLCRGGRTLEAKELLIEMEANGCSPSVITYTCLIHGFCRLNKLEDAMELFKEMKIKGVSPNVYTYSSVIDGLCKNGLSSQAKLMLEKMIRDKLVPNFITYSSLIHGFCSQEGSVVEAVGILDRMKLQNLKPDAGLYSKITNALCDSSRFREAADFIDEMILSGVTPNRVTWGLHVRIHNRVIRGLCVGVAASSDRAFALYRSARCRGVSVEAETYRSLIEHCRRDAERVSRILDEMVVDGCVPCEGTWSAVMDAVCCDRKMSKREARLLQDELI